MIKKFCFSTINQTLQRMLFLHFEISGRNFFSQENMYKTIWYIGRFPIIYVKEDKLSKKN